MIFVKVEDYSDIWVQFYHYEVMDKVMDEEVSQ